MWNCAKYGAYALLSVVLTVLGVISMYKGFSFTRTNYAEGAFIDYNYEHEKEPSLLAILAIVLGFILILVGVISFNITWLQIILAPKVWLIEYAAKLTTVAETCNCK